MHQVYNLIQKVKHFLTCSHKVLIISIMDDVYSKEGGLLPSSNLLIFH